MMYLVCVWLLIVILMPSAGQPRSLFHKPDATDLPKGVAPIQASSRCQAAVTFPPDVGENNDLQSTALLRTSLILCLMMMRMLLRMLLRLGRWVWMNKYSLERN